jgi:predicted N-acetyltransferase YhbS
MRIATLADHPEHAETIARWHRDEWGSVDPSPLEVWTERMRERAPRAFVALDRGEPIGAAYLVDRDMDTHPDLGPWLAGVYVRADRRGEGVGAAIVRHASDAAAAEGAARLFLYTGEDVIRFYERLGWRVVGEEVYNGEDVMIMALDLSVL